MNRGALPDFEESFACFESVKYVQAVFYNSTSIFELGAANRRGATIYHPFALSLRTAKGDLA